MIRPALPARTIERAAAFFACTDDDLANIQSCLHAKRLNPEIVTVARVLDEMLVGRLGNAFQIDRSLSASHEAIDAFVGAAEDEHAQRTLELGDLKLAARRHKTDSDVSLEELAAWRARGAHVLAIRRSLLPLEPPSNLDRPLSAGDEVILCGPSEDLEAIAS